MAKSLGRILLLLSFFTLFGVVAQDMDGIENNALRNFQIAESPLDRFNYFFATVNRYGSHSPYDWLDSVKKYIERVENADDSLALNQYKLIQAQLYFDLNDFNKSITIASELYSQKHIFNLDAKSILLNLMDDNYAQLQLFDKQVEIRKQKRELGLTENIAFYDIYSSLGLHRQAMKDYIRDVKPTIKENAYFDQARYNNNIGNYLRLDKRASTALAKFSTAKGYIDVWSNDMSEVKTESEIINGNILRGIIEGNIGKCYVQLGQFEKAIPYLENSIAIIEENNIGKSSTEVNENVLALAESHLKLENLKMARDYLELDLKFSSVDLALLKNRLFASYYDKISDFEKQSFYLKKNVRIRDSLEIYESDINKQRLAAFIGQEEVKASRQELNRSESELEQARLDFKKQDERINLVLISLVFTLLGFAGLVYAYLKSIKNQRIVAEQKHIIENALVEKDSLLKEIHHRVKNNLQMVSSLLSLQTKNTRSKAAIEALEEGKSRVKAMALIHQKLYQNDDLSVIEMQGYIESLVNSIQSVFKKGGHNINITIDAEGVELDIDRAIPFGLILNELVSNSFKYAFPEDDDNGKIYIHLRKNGGQGFFEYTDNGVGLPEDSEERASSSMGIRLMNRLVNQLQSTLNTDKTTEGVRFWFNFK